MSTEKKNDDDDDDDDDDDATTTSFKPDSHDHFDVISITVHAALNVVVCS